MKATYWKKYMQIILSESGPVFRIKSSQNSKMKNNLKQGTNDLNTFFTDDMYIANKHMRTGPVSLIIRKMQMLGRIWSIWNSLMLLVRIGNGKTTLEYNLAVSLKKLNTLNIQCSYFIPRYVLKEMKVYVHKILFIAVSFVIAKNWKQPNLSINRWIDKVGTVVPLIHRGYFPRSSVDVWNHRWYWTLYVLCFFLYIHTYGKV